MIERLLGMAGAAVAYFCTGTVLAQAIMLLYLLATGYLTGDKFARIAAVLRGDDAAPAAAGAPPGPSDASGVSLADLAQARAAQSRDYELREQSLRNALADLNFQRTKLAQDISRYNQQRTSFETQLASQRQTLSSESQDNAVQTLQNLKPKQAKDQLLRMVDAGEVQSAVNLLVAMSVNKRAKVAGEFKTEEEGRKLAEILKLIREGHPELTLIDETQARLQPVPASQP